MEYESDYPVGLTSGIKSRRNEIKAIQRQQTSGIK